jgi:serine phosphatase RsbU (regulator of sigma subunit)
MAGARGGEHERLWHLLPWLLLVGIALAELAEDLADLTNVRTSALLSPVPALAAIRGRPATVALTIVAAVLVGLLGLVFTGTETAGYQVTVFGSVILVGLTSLFAARVRERREAQFAQVRRVSEAAQLALLPPVPAWAGEVRIAARYVAAESEARIGGDLYEVVTSRDHTRLIIGDVRGKGLPAVRTAAAVLGAFREAAHHEVTLSGVATRCSEAVGRLEMDGATGFTRTAEAEELFVTAVVLEIEGPMLRLVNLGHPPPLLLSAREARYVEARETLPPLGLAHQLSGAFPVHLQRWRPGERLLLYTDGIDEARDRDGAFFPLLRSVGALLDRPTEELPDLLLGAVDRHTGGRLQDDAAIVVAEWSAELPAGPALEQPPFRLSGS